jgi:dTDP-4-dehydrorhamnose reductase
MTRVTIWVTGATGLLGGWVCARLRDRGASDFTERVELTDASAVARALDAVEPATIIHLAAKSAVADCHRDPASARAINVEAPATLARRAARDGVRFVHISTDHVFDGEAAPYREHAARAPISAYGRTKAEAEERVLAAGGDAAVVRLALLYGPTRTARRGFFDGMLDALRAGAPLRLFDDEWRTPLSLRRAAEALDRIAASDVRGVVHVGGPERMSRLAMGERLAALLGVSASGIVATSRASIGGEPRARDLSLDSGAFRARFPVDADDFEAECRAMGVTRPRT